MTHQYIYNKKVQNATIRRRLDHRFVRWVFAAAVVGSSVAFAYVYSARCHFEAVTLGYETQQIRADLAKSVEERRQLELDRQRELAPEQLEKRARKLGLCAPQFAVATATPEPARPGASSVQAKGGAR